MRSVVGVLPITLGLLMVIGCALPQRNVAEKERSPFRSKRASAGTSSADDKLTFKAPRKKPRSHSNDESQSNTDDLAVGEKSPVKKGGKGSKEIASTALDEVDENLAERTAATAPKIKQVAANSNPPRSAVGPASEEWRDDWESPVQDNPVQLQQEVEFDSPTVPNASDTSQIQQSSIVEASQAKSDASSGRNQNNAQNNSQLPLWSDQPAGQDMGQSATGKSPAPSTTNRVTQATNSQSSANRTAQSFPGAVNPPPWQGDLNQLIAEVEQRLAQPSALGQSRDVDLLRSQAEMRLLYLIAQRQEEALTVIPGLTSAQQEYWQQMIWAIFNSLDTSQFPELSDRAAHAVVPLSSALRHLREEAPLAIKNMAFCKKISGFGNYERFPRNEFPPGYEVLLYTEIENFVSSPTGDGEYRTSLRSAIEIMNATGKVVWSKKFAAPTEDLCRNPRRDYFQNCHFHIPEDLPTGEYSLSLTIADEVGHKQASSSLKFVLK